MLLIDTLSVLQDSTFSDTMNAGVESKSGMIHHSEWEQLAD